ncbi:MAG TPA: plasmid maintenance protein CcdB [Chromatiales bacterium]|nr:plasmid maintenance protein CcdB [Chromatiales bacterium]HEX22613.1 plasmid maintenance protein CcdB [Chromatiales bacterium]
MSQFTVYKNKNPRTKKTFPYLLDIQSDLLDQLRTTIVVPLGKYSVVKEQVITKLCPIVEIDGVKYAALTQQLAGIDRTLLGAEVANVSDYRSEFIDAIDLIVSGI